MKQLLNFSLILTVLLLAGAGCNYATTDSPTSTTIDSEPQIIIPGASSTTSTADNNAESQTVDVQIKNSAFSPATITIRVGDTVRWINTDFSTHKVASDPHPAHTDLPGLVSPILNQGDTYSFTFNKSGTWDYHCHLHPYMLGKVIVQPLSP